MCFRRNEKEMKWNKLITCEHDSRAVWSENKNEKKVSHALSVVIKSPQDS